MNIRKNIIKIAALSLLGCFPCIGFSATLDGASLSLMWGIPFLAVLLSIALFPIFAPDFWHHHFGKIMACWVVIFLVPFTSVFGFTESYHLISHALLTEYIPFIVLLFSLFTVSGGILVRGRLQGTVRLNIIILAIGTVLASIMGTTGAAMLLIRPLLRANSNRKNKVHIVIFFIFLVANIGGGLTPLGDPPLFLGFLQGVDFSWTMKHMMLPVLISAVILLVVFYFIDRHFYRKEQLHLQPKEVLSDSDQSSIKIVGKFNIIFLLAIIGCVLLSGIWNPHKELSVFGQHLALQNVVRDVLLFIIAIASLLLTPKKVRHENGFNWEPILEVAKLFIAIFITIGPVISILRAAHEGQLSGLVTLVQDGNGMPINGMYFWMTGMLSAFLDNAPTYLVFFNLASGDATTLMGPLASTLLAISMGAVFMGALTYVGNAPNFMVRSIAIQNGVKMPSFFGYIKWSAVILIPLFVVLMFIFF